MKVIAHQTISVHLPRALAARATEQLEEACPITIIPEDILSPVTPA
jgi:hypothetical protein